MYTQRARINMKKNTEIDCNELKCVLKIMLNHLGLNLVSIKLENGSWNSIFGCKYGFMCPTATTGCATNPVL